MRSRQYHHADGANATTFLPANVVFKGTHHKIVGGRYAVQRKVFELAQTGDEVDGRKQKQARQQEGNDGVHHHAPRSARPRRLFELLVRRRKQPPSPFVRAVNALRAAVFDELADGYHCVAVGAEGHWYQTNDRHFDLPTLGWNVVGVIDVTR